MSHFQYRFIYFMIILIFCTTSCKEENNAKVMMDENSSEAEKVYFADYQSPRLKWSYIDQTGEMLTQAIYDDVRDFTADGLALASDRGKWGFIDRKAKAVIPHLYLDASPFSEGKAWVKDFDNTSYFIDKSSRKLCSCPGESCTDFRNGYSVFSSNGFYGLMDSLGAIALEPKYKELTICAPNMIIALLDEKFNLIHPNGKVLINKDFDRLYEASEGFIRFKDEKGYGFLSTASLKTLASKLSVAKDFKNGFAAVTKGNQVGLIDSKGIFTDYQCKSMEACGSNLWLCRDDNGMQLVDNTGKTIGRSYDAIMKESEGIIGFQTGESWGYMDTLGQQILAPIFPIIWDYKEGFVRVITSEGFIYLNKQGNRAFNKSFTEARDFVNGFARVQL